MNWNPAADGPPRGWLESVGAIYRAYLPVRTELKGVDLAPGRRFTSNMAPCYAE
ncbi:hypothetical protein JCM18916_2685 [Cutibacterium acnes JCM 18916]|nr:hypothetical protein JCM18916_2685 [Cutibacterium acnes JCM 18916]